MTTNFRPGDKVYGMYEGVWYTGIIKSIDFDSDTVHIIYVDGQEE